MEFIEKKNISLNTQVNHPKHVAVILRKTYPELYNEIKAYNEKYQLATISFSQMLYNFTHNIQAYPKCKGCTNTIDYRNFGKNLKWGYNNYCSRFCVTKDLENLKRRGETRKTRNIKFSDTVKKTKVQHFQQFENNLLSIDQLKQILNTFNNTNIPQLTQILLHQHPQVYVTLSKIYPECKRIVEKIYRIQNNLLEHPKCTICNMNFKRFISYSEGYDNLCGNIVCTTAIKGQNKKIKIKELLASTEPIPLDFKQQIKEIVVKYSPNSLFQIFIKYYPSLIRHVLNKTSYLRENAKFTERIYHLIHDLTSKKVCIKCGFGLKFFSFTDGYNGCGVCDIKFSKAETQIRDLLSSLNIEYKSNDRSVLKKLELDLYIPSHNLAIEYNGSYWHSTTFKDKNYHVNKTKLCLDQGIQLFQIFSNEWSDPRKQEIWKSVIKNKLGNSIKIFARKCTLKEISSLEKSTFLNDNHLQGNDNSSIRFGAFYNQELVSVMTFGRSRYTDRFQYELIRFCSRRDYIVVGIASRLFQHFVKIYKPESIISYADRRRSTGGIYTKIGFQFSHFSSPSYFYVNTSDTLIKRELAQKHKLIKLLKDKFDPNLSESDNMKNAGYRKVYDCGNYVFNWKPPIVLNSNNTIHK